MSEGYGPAHGRDGVEEGNADDVEHEVDLKRRRQLGKLQKRRRRKNEVDQRDLDRGRGMFSSCC